MSSFHKDCKEQPLKVGSKVIVRYSFNAKDLHNDTELSGCVCRVIAFGVNSVYCVSVSSENAIEGTEWFHPSEVLKVPQRYLGKKNEDKLRAFAKLAGFWQKDSI